MLRITKKLTKLPNDRKLTIRPDSFFNNYYAYFRTNGDGTGGQSITISTNGQINLEWLNYFDDNQAQYTDSSGNLVPAKGVHARWIPPTDSTMVEGAAMLDSGVIFLGSAGNNNNQQVKINNFGEEDISYITPEKRKNLLN